IGTEPVLSLASALGLHDMPNVPSLALGTGVLTPLELTAAYAAFPNGGFSLVPRGIVRILDAEDAVVVEDAVRRKRVLPEPVAFQTLTMLRDVVDLGTASGARALGVRGPVAGKTGTTSD